MNASAGAPVRVLVFSRQGSGSVVYELRHVGGLSRARGRLVNDGVFLKWRVVDAGMFGVCREGGREKARGV